MSGEAEVKGGTDLTALGALLSISEKRSKMRFVLQAGILGYTAYQTGKRLYSGARVKLTHTITLSGEDEIYNDAHKWLLDLMPSEKRKSLTVESGRGEIEGSSSDLLPPGVKYNRRRKGRLHLFYNGARAQKVDIDGHTVTVQITANVPAGMSIDDMPSKWRKGFESITFTCKDEQGRNAVLGFLTKLAEERHAVERARFYVAMRWGDWKYMSTAKRPLDTVILKEGQLESIVADLSKFLSSEELYTRVGKPWHRGYLFHGPPGTGKTSLAKALAEHFELDVHYLPLSDVKTDTALLQLLAGVEQKSVLVLEDIDIVHAASSRDDAEADGITLSGLLNSLDGMATPHGLITIMTTNNESVLDAALKRPGRVDRSEHLGYVDDEQFTRLSDLILGYPLKEHVPEGLTHAELIESVATYLDDAPSAEEALLERLARAKA